MLGATEQRCTQVLALISAFAKGDLSRRVELSGAGDEVDAMIGGLHMLAEEMQRRIEELETLHGRLAAENESLRLEVRDARGEDGLVGPSEGLRRAIALVDRVAPTEATVLLQGETGTGKELMARAIHARSPRRDAPMVSVNCAALPRDLVESELFGHERGAFTGAGSRRVGRFEEAHKGTLLLDEIGDLPFELQGRLLRVLQEQTFHRVGGVKAVTVDVRVIAATHRDLRVDVDERRFRADLYYRLCAYPVAIPPLRERRDDIVPLALHFLGRFNERHGRRVLRIGADALAELEAWSWPGNVRELEGVIERGVIRAEGAVLNEVELDPRARGTAPPVVLSLEQVQVDLLESVLDATGWVIEGERGAASQLGLAPSTVRSKIRRFGLQRPRRQSVG